jgi:hypothetical protein
MSHITIAASANAFEQIFNAVRDHFHFSQSDSATFGPFSASYSVALHLEGGTLQLNDDNTIEVQDVDIVFDTLMVQVCFTIPGWCTPSFCIIPDPWNGCLVGFPAICIPPGGGTTICITLDLSGLVSEISDLKASLLTNYFVDPARLPAWSDLDAEFAGHPNKWRIFVDPVWVHVDPIDIPATVGNLFENAVHNAIDNLFPSWVPQWAKDWIWAIIGPVIDVIKNALNIFGEINEWLADLLGNQFDLLGLIETAIADYFASQNPIYEFEDPFPILPADGILIPVKVPIRDLTAEVNSREMIVRANIGG